MAAHSFDRRWRVAARRRILGRRPISSTSFCATPPRSSARTEPVRLLNSRRRWPVRLMPVSLLAFAKCKRHERRAAIGIGDVGGQCRGGIGGDALAGGRLLAPPPQSPAAPRAHKGSLFHSPGSLLPPQSLSR